MNCCYDFLAGGLTFNSELIEAQGNNYLRLQSENRALELRCDRLRAQKRRISAGWRKDWKVWKECKEALLRDKENRGLVISHLKQFEENCEYEKMVKEKDVGDADNKVDE